MLILRSAFELTRIGCNNIILIAFIVLEQMIYSKLHRGSLLFRVSERVLSSDGSRHTLATLISHNLGQFVSEVIVITDDLLTFFYRFLTIEAETESFE